MVSDHRPQTQTPDPDMTGSKMDEVKDDRNLKGKTNFIGWKREFDRAAKANDILEYLTGDEVVPPKPKKEDYFVKSTEADTRRPIRAKKLSQIDKTEQRSILRNQSTPHTFAVECGLHKYLSAKLEERMWSTKPLEAKHSWNFLSYKKPNIPGIS